MNKVKIVKINEPISKYNRNDNDKITSKSTNKTLNNKVLFNKLLSSPKKVKQFLEKRYKKTKINKEKYTPHTSSNVSNTSSSSNYSEQSFKSQFKSLNKHSQSQNVKHTNKEKKMYKSRKVSKRKYTYYSKNEVDSIFKNICEGKKVNTMANTTLTHVFKKIIKKNNNNLTNIFINKVNRTQTLYLLYLIQIVPMQSNAPTPLLKNILYNYLTSTIKIIRL